MITDLSATGTGIVGAGAACRTAPAISTPILLGGVNVHASRANAFCVGDRGALCIDWIAGSIPRTKLKDLKEHLEHLFDVKSETCEYGFHMYDRHYAIEPYGIRILFDSTITRSDDLHGGRCMIQIPATALKTIDGFQLHYECRTLLQEFWFKCTRIDTTYDDFQFVVLPQGVESQAVLGNYKGFRTHHGKHGYSAGSLSRSECNFGLRGKDGSGRYLRCYHKSLESKGEINSIRWEVEYSKEHAEAVFLRIAGSTESDHVSEIGKLVGGSIDFIDRGVNKQACRAPRLDFWQKILDDIGASKVRVEQGFSDIPKVHKWLSETAMSSLAMLRKAYGDDLFYTWLNGSIDGAQIRLNDKRLFLAQDWLKNHPHSLPEPMPF